MNIVRTGVRSVWKRSWTFLGVELQHSGSERDKLDRLRRVRGLGARYNSLVSGFPSASPRDNCKLVSYCSRTIMLKVC